MVLLEYKHGVNCLSKVVILMWDKLFQKRLKRIEKRGERQKAKQELIDKYAGYYPSKRRKVSNIMLFVVVTAIVGYVAANFILQYKTGMSMDSTITTAWFSFFTVEIVALTGIKVSKVVKPPLNDNEHISDLNDEESEYKEEEQ